MTAQTSGFIKPSLFGVGQGLALRTNHQRVEVMDMSAKAVSSDVFSARLGADADMRDIVRAIGMFHAVFRDRDGRVYHEEDFPNVITTAGKNFQLDTTLAGSSYTVVGPYMGLISSTSFANPVIADTMASHAGWLEAGTTNAPTYSARIICAWSAASAGAKSLSAPLVFTFTGSGTVSGAFIVTGTGAVVTNLSTVGTLYSAGPLGTAQPVISGNTLSMSYTSTLT
jgi:hypothetical protein